MKISIFNGSPRKHGNSAYLSNFLTENIDSPKVTSTFLIDKDIKPCVDCRLCKKGELICPVDDDMSSLYKIIDNSNLLVFSTPIYWFGPTGIMKNFIDRFRPYFSNNKLSGKNAVVILTAGSGKGDCDLTAEMFKRIFNALKINCLGIIMAEAFDKDDAQVNNRIKEEVSRLADRINMIR